MGEERPFKKATLGGFNRKDVIEYIEQLMSELEDVRAQLKRRDERIDDLERKLEQYEQACTTSVTEEDSGKEVDVAAQIDAILAKYLGKGE